MLLKWEDGRGELLASVQARLGVGREGSWIRGGPAWGSPGVGVARIRGLPATLYDGELFADNMVILLPRNPEDLPAVWGVRA